MFAMQLFDHVLTVPGQQQHYADISNPAILQLTGTPASAACNTAASTPAVSFCWLFSSVPSTSEAIILMLTAGFGGPIDCCASGSDALVSWLN